MVFAWNSLAQEMMNRIGPKAVLFVEYENVKLGEDMWS